MDGDEAQDPGTDPFALVYRDQEAVTAPPVVPESRVGFASWYDPKTRQKELDNEDAIMRMVRAWDAKEAVPVSVQLSMDNGYRCFINPHPAATDQQKHALLAWLVRNSGKRFYSFFRSDEQRVAWWNANHAKDAPNDNEEFLFDGRALKALLFLEHAPKPPGCTIVTETKTVQVRTLKCSGGNPGSPAGVAAPETAVATVGQVPL